MQRFRPFVITSVLWLGACSSYAGTDMTRTVASGTTVTLLRTTCYGNCPAYRVTVTPDGHVTFDGMAFVQTRGVTQTQVSPTQVATILAAVRAADLRSLHDHYSSNEDGCEPLMSDMPGVQITISDAQGSKTVDYYYGCHGAIADQVRPRIERLAHIIDQQLDTTRWIGKPTAPAGVDSVER